MLRLLVLCLSLILASAPALAGDSDKTPRTDLYGDPLPAGALARLGTNRLRQGGLIHAISLSPDGKTLATGSGDTVRLFDVASGRELHTMRGHSTPTALLFTSDKKTLITGDYSGMIRLWDLTDGTELRRFAMSSDVMANRTPGVPAGRIASMLLSKDGRTLWVADGETICQWLPSVGLDMRKISLGAGRILALGLSADGKKLHAAASDGTLRIWDLDKNQEARRFNLPVRGPRFGTSNESVLAFSPDGKQLAIASMNTPVQVLDVESGETGPEIAVLERTIAVSFSPNGKVLAAASAKGVTLWGLASRATLRQFDAPIGVSPRSHLTFSVDGKTLAFGAGEQTVRLWNVATGKELNPTGGHEAGISAVAFAGDGSTILSAAADRTVRLWDPVSGKQLASLPRQDHVSSAVAAPDRGVFYLLGQGLFQPLTWDGKSLIEGRRVVEGRSPGRAFAGSAARGWFALLGTNSIEIVDARTGQTVSRTEKTAETFRTTGFAFSPDGELLATGGLGTAVQLWRTRTGRLVRTLSISREGTTASHLLFSTDGKMLVGSGGAVHFWEVASGQERFQFTTPQTRSQRGLAFSPSNRVLLMGGTHGSIFFFDPVTGRQIDEWSGHRGDIRCLDFSSDGKKLVSGAGDCTALVWDASRIDQKLHRPTVKLSEEEVEVLWKVLAEPDAPRAYRAIAALASAPDQSVPMIAKRLQPADAIETKLITQWVADLDHAQFAPRRKAQQELERVGDLAEDALSKALTGNPSLEMRSRIMELLSRISTTTPQKLQTIRALEALELARTPAARQTFNAIAGGPSGHWLTEMARQSLQRIDHFGPSQN